MNLPSVEQVQSGTWWRVQPGLWAAACFLLFIGLCVAIQAYTMAPAGDLGRTGDEAGHFVSSAMIRDYTVLGLGSNPMRFALDYYAHLPRVSIGHWPPFFHLVQASVFLLTGVSFAAALGFQAVIAGTAAALTAAVVYQQAGRGWRGSIIGAAAGFAVLASPHLLRSLSTVMLDTFLAVLVVLSALAWAAYVRSGRAIWSVVFGLVASAAILTKGNAFGLGLLPIIYVALSGQLRLLANWRTWLSAAIVLLLTVPWYALTYRIVSDGFVYSWGMDYTARAIPAFSRAALDSFGPVALAGFAVAVVAFSRRARRGDREETILSCAAAAAGLFLFQVVAPADLSPRYLIAILPCVLIVSACGIAMVAATLCRGSGTISRWLPATAVVVGLILNAGLTFRVPPTSPDTMNKVAQALLAAPESAPLVLVAAGPHGEGALIAAFAAFDASRAHYVIRASKAFATSNFMGFDYRPRFSSAAETAKWIAEHRIGWLVLDDEPRSMAMLHNQQLASLADAGQPGWRLVFERSYGQGGVRLFRLDGPAATPADIAVVLRQVAPIKVIGGSPDPEPSGPNDPRR
jgi:hypothetical protein